MGIFEFDKLHCLHGDKGEQSDSYLNPEKSGITRHVFEQTATPGAHQKTDRRTKRGVKPGAARHFAKSFPQHFGGRDQISADMLTSKPFQ